MIEPLLLQTKGWDNLDHFMDYQRVVTTGFKKNKQIVLSSLFIIYYVVYAISPLSYTYDVKRIVGDIGDADGMSASLNNFSIFLVEVVCDQIDSVNEFDHTNSTVTVLISKKRAVLPDNASVKFAPSENLWLFGHITIFFASRSRLLVSSDDGNSSLEFNPLHSGPAPPLA
ncbi:MAG: hypothetical protein ACLQF0_10630 [Dissulfurispiraceae bacterium]